MEQPLKHPDIVDPYRIGLSSFGERPFVKDLDLAALLGSVPFYSDKTRKLAMDVVADRGSDMKTVEYRQDVLQELVSSESLLASVQRIPSLLNRLAELGLYFLGEPSLTRGIRVLRDYRDFIKSPPDLSQAKSKALKEVESYLAAVRASDEFTGLCGFLDTGAVWEGWCSVFLWMETGCLPR